jgi:hypothetical protein
MVSVCSRSGKINVITQFMTVQIDIFRNYNCLFFIQAELFQQTVLKLEGDDVSATECSTHLEQLKGNLMLRKNEKFVDAATEKEMERIVKSGKSERKPIEDVFCEFYGKLEFIKSRI